MSGGGTGDQGTGPALPALPPADMPWPFDGPAFRMSMGLRALAPAAWIQPDAEWPRLLAGRRELLRTRRGDVLALMPEATPAARELIELLADHLTGRFPDLFTAADGWIESRITGERLPLDGSDPLAVMGALVADDLCIMTRTPGGWRLTGAVLCFPNRWRLADKLGKPMPGIHRPVPGYDRTLAVPVDRFFDALADGKAVWRTNWALNDDPALFQPVETAHTSPDRTITAENAGNRLFLRVERQTLRHLPGSGAVIFGIRTYQRAIGQLSPDHAADLAGVIRTAPEDTARYKGLIRTAGPALAVLDRIAAGGQGRL